MKIKTVELETIVGPTSKIPLNSLPEVAFAGKSNVGKSSLINALIVAIGIRRRNEISATFSQLERIWSEYEVYEKSDEHENL